MPTHGSWHYLGVVRRVRLDTLTKKYSCEYFSYDKDGKAVDCGAPADWDVICKDGVDSPSCWNHLRVMMKEHKERQIGKGFEQGYI